MKKKEKDKKKEKKVKLKEKTKKETKEVKRVRKPREKGKKVRDLAKELEMSSKALQELMKEMGIEVKSHTSLVDEDTEKKIKEFIERKKTEEMEMLKKKKEIWGEEEKELKTVEEGPVLTEEEIEHKLKETLSRLRTGPKIKKKIKKEKEETETLEEVKENILYIPGALTVGEFAKMMGVDPARVIEKCISHGVFATINQVINVETMMIIGEEFGFKVEIKAEELVEEEKEELGERRPPVITVLGHVDHGKTTLLDYIRKTKLAEKEPGRITQHIGAYQIEYQGHKITFIDTPGHEAFTALRARGVQVTDIALLLVAANEGVKEQTREAISHAKAAGVPIIVAVNKMDLPNANLEKVMAELAEEGLVPEEWGGKTIVVPISAKTGMGIDNLLEAILLVAEELDIRTSLKDRARAVVIETKLDKGRGPLCTVIVQRGILRKKDPVLVGTTWGKVRNLYNEWDQVIEEAYPSTPCVVQGLEELPTPGDILITMPSEKEAKEEAERRKELKKEQIKRAELQTALTNIQEKILKGELKELPLIIKADTQGSVDALSDTLSKMQYEEIKVNVIHKGIGMVTENDVLLASASKGVILAFNTGVDSKARNLVKNEKILIMEHKIIYHALDEIQKLLVGMLEPEEVEEVVGEAEVKKVFRVSKLGFVAGCLVKSGKIVKGYLARVKRNGEVIHEGKIDSLKHYQEDVSEIESGKECGLHIENYSDIKEGDIIEVFIKIKKEKTLK
ncbi:MAG: translation initiation factor IF-2 [candidate division WOR-3 bacterium]